MYLSASHVHDGSEGLVGSLTVFLITEQGPNLIDFLFHKSGVLMYC
jgi:hypothetical protein